MFSKDNLHHAYICEGNASSIYPKICSFCELELEVSIKANPDFSFEEYDKFTISDARLLREKQLNKTQKNSKQIFIISCNFITREAQNALLKVLEEPTADTHFFIITQSSHVFLPTILSRVVLLKDSNEEESDQKEFINPEKFIKYNSAERLKEVTKLLNAIKKEKASKSDAIKLISSCIKILHKDLQSSKDKKLAKKIENLEMVADYLHDQGASTKILLEYSALII